MCSWVAISPSPDTLAEPDTQAEPNTLAEPYTLAEPNTQALGPMVVLMMRPLERM